MEGVSSVRTSEHSEVRHVQDGGVFTLFVVSHRRERTKLREQELTGFHDVKRNYKRIKTTACRFRYAPEEPSPSARHAAV